MNRNVAGLAIGIAILSALSASAQVSFTGVLYTQNFDTLAATTAASNTWTNNSTLPGWFLFHQPAASPVAITSYGAETGSSGNATYNSYGATSGNTERALGSLGSGGTYWGSPASGAIAGWMALGLTNNSGLAASAFTLSFNGEQWRNGGNTSAQTMVLEYGFGASFGAVTTWTAPGGTFNFTSPVTGATAAEVNGNTTGLVNGLGGTITASWATGDTLWIRWVEANDAGNDHALAIDDLTFSASLVAIPEPCTVVAGVLAALVLLGSQRCRLLRFVRA